MPNRILKESVCTSKTLDYLTWFERVFFYHLIVNADDYGRFFANANILRSSLFPRSDIPISEIENALDSLVKVNLIELYTVESEPYLQLITWDEHQTIRDDRKRKKHPSPSEKDTMSDTCQTVDGQLSGTSQTVGRQMSADCPPNPIQSNPIHNPIQSNAHVRHSADSNEQTAQSSDDLMEESFDQFWKAYPKKVSKGQAQTTWKKLWNRLEMDEAFVEKILETVRKQKLKGGKLAGEVEYIPYPSTWLNALSWEDEDGIGRNLEGEDWEYGDPEEFEMLFAWENEASGE